MRGRARVNYNDPINAGLTGYWPMDGGTLSGTLLADVSSLGNNGTLVASPPLVQGRIGQALSFNGSTQYVLTTAPCVMNNFSFSAWIFPNSLTGFPTVVSGSVNLAIDVDINSNGTIRLIRENTALVATSTGAVASGQWNHVGISFNELGDYLFCINGAIEPFTATGGSSFITSGTIAIGVNGDDGAFDAAFFNGLIDDVRYWTNRALSGADHLRTFRDTSGNLGLLTPVRSVSGVSAAPPAPTGKHMTPLLGAGGMIAIKAAHMAETNPRPTRREFLALKGKR